MIKKMIVGWWLMVGGWWLVVGGWWLVEDNRDSFLVKL